MLGMDYASIDNSIPASPVNTNCQVRPAYIPTGWMIAADNDRTKITIMGGYYAWDTTCMVLSSGKSYFSDLTLCVNNSISLFTFTSGDMTVAKVNSCSQRIMISRNSTASANTYTMIATPTNTIVSGATTYATLDNALPTDPSNGCQNRALGLPTGWTLAKSNSSTFSTVLAANWFGAWCMLVDGGASITHDMQSCGNAGELLSLTYDNVKYYAVNHCDRRIMIEKYVPTPRDFKIGMKVLVLTATNDTATDPPLGAIRITLDGVGVPYDVMKVSNTTVLNFTDVNNNPKYYSIVLTNQYLTVPATGLSALSDAQWTYIKQYKFSYKVRLFSGFSYPVAAEYNLTLPSEGSSAQEYLQFDPTATAFATSAGMKSNMAMQLAGSTYHYKATIKSGSTNVTPVLRFTSTSTKAATSSDSLAAGIFRMADGTEEMHWMFDFADWSMHGLALGGLWLKWVTRGIFMGERRVMLNMQVDDLFLSTGTFLWGWPNLKDDYEGPEFRLNGSELTWLKNYKQTLNNKLPAGSYWTLEMGFNGVGVTDFTGGDSLWTAAVANRDVFRWESHTWSHLDLTCGNDSTALTCARTVTTYAQAFPEFKNNIDFAMNHLYADRNFTTYSSKCMITPGISGLFNAASLRAMVENGITCVVGDNTRADLQATNWYQGFYLATNRSVFVVPRYATRVGFDVSLPKEMEDENNYVYGPQGLTPFYDHNVTLQELLDAERDRVVPALLSYRHDPYMFHQANLRTFTYNGATHTLITLWADAVVNGYLSVMNLPVLSLKHDDLYNKYMERRQRDGATPQMQMTVSNCKATSLSLTANGACKVSVTGLNSGGSSVEHYGPDNNIYVNAVAGTPSVINIAAADQATMC